MACVSVLPRVVAALGFKPALLIQDSFSYMAEGVHLAPLSQLRPAGYPLLLRVLKPFHSLLLVTTLQHLMGIALGAIIYGVLRTRGLPAWGATLAAAPTLFDSRQIWLESSILPDTLFTLVLMIAVAILIVAPKPTIWQAVIVGLLVSWASVIRGNGAPVFVIILAFLLVQRVGWKVFIACLAAFAVPLLGYALLFFSEYGQFDITNSTGMFLWSRTMSFANCAVIKPPADLLPLCPQSQPDHPTVARPGLVRRRAAERAHPRRLPVGGRRLVPVDAHPGINAYNNKLAMEFAERAIAAQPLDYAQDGGRGRAPDLLRHRPVGEPTCRITSPWPRTSPRSRPYMKSDEHKYAHTTSNTHVVQPWAYFMFLYQLPVWFPGIVFFVVMVGGLVVLIGDGAAGAGTRAWPGGSRWSTWWCRSRRDELDYRYALSAVPFACLALGLACIPEARAAGHPASAGR